MCPALCLLFLSSLKFGSLDGLCGGDVGGVGEGVVDWVVDFGDYVVGDAIPKLKKDDWCYYQSCLEIGRASCRERVF